MNKLTANKPLIWSVLAGLLTDLLAFWIPGLRELLGIVHLSLEEWSWVIGAALVLLATVEAAKAIANRLRAND